MKSVFRSRLALLLVAATPATHFAGEEAKPRVAADDAAIGIAEFSRAADRRGTVNFGAHPDWAPQVGIEPIGQVSIGAHVQNGQMKGWFYIQFWA